MSGIPDRFFRMCRAKMKKTTAFIISHEPDPSRTEKEKTISIIALTLTRALGRENINVVRVHPNLLDDSLSSRYCNAIEVCPNLHESEDALTAFLIELSNRYPGKKVLIPASDDCSVFLAKHADSLGETFTLLNPSASSMERLKNKRLQYELAEASGVPIPETLFPTDREELEKTAEKLGGFPYIIKPLEAQKWRLKRFAHVANGKKAITVNTREELLSEYQRIAEHDEDVMVQEVIAGDDEHLITFLGYCSDEHKPLAYCIRSKLRQNPVDFGYCTATVSCHNDEVEQYARQLLARSDYTGIVGIEFKFDGKSKQYKLIEINTRPVNTTGLSIGCGVNLPLIAYLDAIGEEQEPVTEWQDGVTWIWMSLDISAARQLRELGRLTWREWLQSIRGKRVHAIFAADDLRPCIQFYTRYVMHRIDKIMTATRIPVAIRGTLQGLERMATRIW
jgi:predicted ATP-grasp superfamily ATP-dependent carboligase